MPTKILPIYDRLFPTHGAPPNKEAWDSFSTKPTSKDAVCPSEVDFALGEERTWTAVAKDVGVVSAKIALFPWGCYETVKYLVGRIVMYSVLPAQFRSKSSVDAYRKEIFEVFAAHQIIARHVTLQKNGMNFRGILFGAKKNISNGRWVLSAVGNAIFVEEGIVELVSLMKRCRFNVLLINEPNVGKSEGWATAENMGHSQEVGLSFLESAIKARQIALCGFSIGVAAIGKAILMHAFKHDTQYFVASLMSFDRLSHIAEKFVGSIGGKAVQWLDDEMDTVAASKKLQELGIPELVIQGEKDEMMQGAELQDALLKQGIVQNKEFIRIANAGHEHFPINVVAERLQNWAWPKSFIRRWMASVFATLARFVYWLRSALPGWGES